MDPNVPSIFDTYKSFENDGPELNLRILKPLDANTCSSVFHVYAENIQPNAGAPAQADGNCAAKLAFRHYGLEVNRTLAPDFAPRLLGVSLSSLTTPWIGSKLEKICSALDTFIKARLMDICVKR